VKVGETVSSEFATVEIGVDHAGNGPRLRIEDQKSGRVGYLDALELETLAWLPEGGLHPLLDPSAVRWRDQATVDALVRRLYAALAAGDKDTLTELLAPDFEAEFAEAMPVVSGPVRSAEDMIEKRWWALGREFSVRVEPSEWIACGGGRLLVIGRYEGSVRSTGKPLSARFAHLWSARGDVLGHLWHLTDTAAWAEALE
jgi:ketosteroid isomerase-like protein